MTQASGSQRRALRNDTARLINITVMKQVLFVFAVRLQPPGFAQA
jgi:hypothetical protein